MTHGAWEIVGKDDQQIPLDKSIGEAVRGLVRRRWKANAAKSIAQAWDLDPKTARNVIQSGHVSERTLTKAVRAEGWSFLSALGEELTGESFAQYLTRITEAEANVQREREAHRDSVVRLQARASELAAVLHRESP